MCGNFFVTQGNLGEILFILIFCGCGWAEGRRCSGREQKELGKRKTLRISESFEPWKERGEDQALTSSLPWGTAFKTNMFSQLLNCLLQVFGES